MHSSSSSSQSICLVYLGGRRGLRTGVMEQGRTGAPRYCPPGVLLCVGYTDISFIMIGLKYTRDLYTILTVFHNKNIFKNVS